MMMRIGQGFDSHRFAEDRRLVLGGAVIPHERGLLGHSDADALAHAVIDALLGAAGRGDIGARFPDSDPEWKNADSMKMLETVVAEIVAEGWHVVNLDSTVIAEAPKLASYKEAIRANLAAVLGIGIDCVSVKAKTNEGMDAVGRREGLAAMASVLISRD